MSRQPCVKWCCSQCGVEEIVTAGVPGERSVCPPNWLELRAETQNGMAHAELCSVACAVAWLEVKQAELALAPKREPDDDSDDYTANTTYTTDALNTQMTKYVKVLKEACDAQILGGKL